MVVAGLAVGIALGTAHATPARGEGTNSQAGTPVPPAGSQASTLWQGISSYIQSNGVLHVGIGYSLRGGDHGPLLAQSVSLAAYTNRYLDVAAGVAHADLFSTKSGAATSDQLGAIFTVDVLKLPSVTLVNRVMLFGYIGVDSDSTLQGDFSLKRTTAGGGLSIGF